MNILDDVLTEETVDDEIDENEHNEMPTCIKVGLDYFVQELLELEFASYYQVMNS